MFWTEAREYASSFHNDTKQAEIKAREIFDRYLGTEAQLQINIDSISIPRFFNLHKAIWGLL